MSKEQDPRQAEIELFEELADKHPSIDRDDLARFLTLLAAAARNTIKECMFALTDPNPGAMIDPMLAPFLMREGIINWSTDEMAAAAEAAKIAAEGHEIELTRFVQGITSSWTRRILGLRSGPQSHGEARF